MGKEMIETFSVLVGCLGIAFAGTSVLEAAEPSQAPSRVTSPQAVRVAQTGSHLAGTSVSAVRELINEFCVTCHNDKLKTAGLALDHMDLTKTGQFASVWEKVVQ